MDPKISMWVNFALTVLSGIAGGAAVLTPVFGDAVTHQIVVDTSLALFLVGLVNMGLHGMSAPVAGPMLKLFRKGA